MTAHEPEVKVTSRYSINETAKILNVSRATLYNAIRRGMLTIHIRKANGRTFIIGKDITKFWQEKF